MEGVVGTMKLACRLPRRRVFLHSHKRALHRQAMVFHRVRGPDPPDIGSRRRADWVQRGKVIAIQRLLILQYLPFVLGKNTKNLYPVLFSIDTIGDDISGKNQISDIFIV